MEEIELKTNSKTQTKTVVHTDISKYLKAHQIDGIKFMFENCYEQNSGCILAHCMGLGKTLQVISLLHSVISLKEYSTNKILVLCPISTIINWKEEIVRWLAPINDQRKLQIYELDQKEYVFNELNIRLLVLTILMFSVTSTGRYLIYKNGVRLEAMIQLAV